jgi:magnesium transporter
MAELLKDGAPEEHYFLSDVVGTKVLQAGKKIGTLADLVAKENGKLPFVTHIIVQRSMGYPPLVIPWEEVSSMGQDEIVVGAGEIEKYAVEPSETSLLLKDYVLDKRVLDVTNREV